MPPLHLYNDWISMKKGKDTRGTHWRSTSGESVGSTSSTEWKERPSSRMKELLWQPRPAVATRKDLHKSTEISSLLGDDAPSVTEKSANTGYTIVDPPSVNTGRQMLKRWLGFVILPLGLLTWYFVGDIGITLCAMVSMPLLAIVQGSIAICRYRIKFGNCPVPKAPSHGIVRVTSRSAGGKDNESSTYMGEVREGVDNDSDDAPLRLLVIGDSLAIGVGQSSSSTPVMPETIAKSLSKAMGGRPVLWTCHGAPGASAGWIVRELERSIQQGRFQLTSPNIYHDQHENSFSSATLNMEDNRRSRDELKETSSRDSDSFSDDSSRDEESPRYEERQTWQERLRQECIHFDPNIVGPFDVAIVLTGSNDLKSAFFPFLLTGEDAKFRKEAQERGGSYGNELTRILQVLNQGMRLRLRTLCDDVEEATHNLRERLGSMDGMSHNPNHSGPLSDRTSSTKTQQGIHSETKCTNKGSSLFPMVVLPGMPARALPIFSIAPLRWLAVPVVDMMDSHKQQLAQRHRGEVLFVNAPTIDEIAEYVDDVGDFRMQEKDDRLLLRLRDIKKRHARSLEADMKEYYSQPRNQKPPASFKNRHHDVFSVDGIHPNDVGYSFWGRHIASRIVQEWDEKKLNVAEIAEPS